MTSLLRFIAITSAVLLPLSSLSAADEHVALKCSTNQDSVWVYDSLTTFNVEAKVKCGEAVTLVGRTDGYVEVRTAAGTEGYVPEENVPETEAVAISAAPETNATSRPTSARTTSAPRSAPAQPSARAALPSGTHEAVASTTTSRPQPAAAGISPAIAAEEDASSVPSGSTDRATSAVTEPASAPVAAASVEPHAKLNRTTNSDDASVAALPGNSTAPVAPHEAGTANATVARAFATPGEGNQPSEAASVRPADIYDVGPATTTATPRPADAGNVSDASADDEGDDNSYLIPPKSASDDPACKAYFSGYGLTIAQFTWVVDHRKKSFPAVCPAATPAMVDYVIIFTHDVDFFSYTMPAPIHEEKDGFTDWDPVVLCDPDNVPCSRIYNSRREYVWVFHVKRGTYDPGKFSPHRRFQFAKIESNYSRTVEDAFQFIETHDAAR
ncbi:MAG TPA: hypothetical protein VMF66_16565 [Candidatus Acidoferrum sp.]|nr:hypothetical protein [Candidatus Acidoferrum sp.]